jgi:hypothetical protein
VWHTYKGDSEKKLIKIVILSVFVVAYFFWLIANIFFQCKFSRQPVRNLISILDGNSICLHLKLGWKNYFCRHAVFFMKLFSVSGNFTRCTIMEKRWVREGSIKDCLFCKLNPMKLIPRLLHISHARVAKFGVKQLNDSLAKLTKKSLKLNLMPIKLN